MPPKGKADLAHPQAADWVMGTLGPDEATGFRLHLTNCPHCQAAVAEFGQLGQMLQNLPPAVEPPPGLEARVIASVLAAAAEDRTATEVHHVPEAFPAAADTSSPTQLIQIPAAPGIEAGADEQPGGGTAKVIRFPRWHGRAGLLAIAGVVAAAIIAAAVVVLPRLGGGRITTAQATVVIPLHATTAAKLSGVGAATGQATAQQAGESWTYVMSVHGLRVLPGNKVYECWWAGPGSTQTHPILVSGGTFVVDNSGSANNVTMTTGVDPHQFRIMEITVQSPGDGAVQGEPLLIGQSKTLAS